MADTIHCRRAAMLCRMPEEEHSADAKCQRVLLAIHPDHRGSLCSRCCPFHTHPKRTSSHIRQMKESCKESKNEAHRCAACTGPPEAGLPSGLCHLSFLAVIAAAQPRLLLSPLRRGLRRRFTGLLLAATLLSCAVPHFHSPSARTLLPVACTGVPKCASLQVPTCVQRLTDESAKK
jgi:hypothetical protein